MLNSCVLIGRVCKAIDLRYTQSGKAVAAIRLAVDRGTKAADGSKETDFFDIIAWEKQAETCANHLGVGRLVAVQGRLQNRNWEKDGQRREKTEVVANQVRFLDKAQETEKPPASMGGEPNFDDESDVPF